LKRGVRKVKDTDNSSAAVRPDLFNGEKSQDKTSAGVIWVIKGEKVGKTIVINDSSKKAVHGERPLSQGL
jgi:hypothetical protein